MRKVLFSWIWILAGCPALALAQGDAAATSSPNSATTATSASVTTSPSFKTFKEAYAAGNQALKDRKFEESAADYGAAEDMATTPKAKSQAANAQGWAYLTGRKLSEAKKAFARSIEENADNKVALKNLGAVEYNLYEYGVGGTDDLKDAVKNLEASGENAEDLESAKAALSREEAQAQATPAADPDTSGMNFKALCALSDKLQEQGQTEQAMKVMEKAASIAASPASKAAAANREGRLLLDSRQPAKAESYFEDAVNAQPKNKVYLNNLGWNTWVLYKSGKEGGASLKKAVDSYYQMNAIDPSYHGESLKMALDELKEVDPEAAKAYTVKDETSSDNDKAGNAKDDDSKEDAGSSDGSK